LVPAVCLSGGKRKRTPDAQTDDFADERLFKKVKLLKKRPLRQTSEIDQNEFASFSDEAERA
jgi:hypothetical protein